MRRQNLVYGLARVAQAAAIYEFCQRNTPLPSTGAMKGDAGIVAVVIEEYLLRCIGMPVVAGNLARAVEVDGITPV